jgi:hypothetical protein
VEPKRRASSGWFLVSKPRFTRFRYQKRIVGGGAILERAAEHCRAARIRIIGPAAGTARTCLIIADVMVVGRTPPSRLVGGCLGPQPRSLLEEFAAFFVCGGGALLGARRPMGLHLRFLLFAIG